MSVKYTLPARNDPALLPAVFQNTKLFPLHEEFLATVFPARFSGLTAEGLIDLAERRATRDYYIGSVERILTERGFEYIYTINVAPGLEEVLTLDEVRSVHGWMSESLTLRPLSYAPDISGEEPLARQAAESWVDPGLAIFFGTVGVDFEFIPYSETVGYGRVRLFRGGEFNEANESGCLTFQDIPVIDFAPPDIEGVVGGVITATPQGALSQVASRAARRGTPNAYVDKAMLLFAPFEGKLVRLEVEENEYTVEEVSEEEAEAFWERRPVLPEPPPFDAKYRAFDRFEEMDFSGGVSVERRFGGTTAGLALLQTILTGPYAEYREAGFAIPMAYYLDFLRTNTISSEVDGRLVTYEGYLRELFETEEFRSDSKVRFEVLEEFRDRARQSGNVPLELSMALGARVEEVFGDRTSMVRCRSSSNVDGALELSGADLYESTSVCAADSFDADGSGPSRCDPTSESERTIERALKQVWTSLFTFRAHEEREFFGIPQASAAMGILVTRDFLDAAANGVAITADPANPRDGCYLVSVQVGEESVLGPKPGVLPEVTLLEVVDGTVVSIIRRQSSTLVVPGEVVLSDAKLEELGGLMWHIDESYPVDTQGHDRRDILLDLEFKLEPDESLAVKEIRPTLVTDRPERPTFELVIPPGAAACGTMNLLSPSGNPREEYESKSMVRFRAGRVELPASRCVFSGELFDEVIVGSAQEVAEAEGPGIFRVTERPDLSQNGIVYTFGYRQKFTLPGGRPFEIEIFNLEFAASGGVPVVQGRVLDEELITFDLDMLGFADDPTLTVNYSSCSYALLPAWDVQAELEDGTTIHLRERFLPVADLAQTGPAAVESAEIFVGESRQVVRSYWDLVYASGRHNIGVRYWVFLEPPVSLPGLEGAVHVVEFHAADPPEVFDFVAVPQEAAVRYLDESFEVLARPEVVSFNKRQATERPFLRGDTFGDGSVDLSDAVQILGFLFRNGSLSLCERAADADDDGQLAISDPVWILLHLFRGQMLPEPAGACGTDPTADDLSCERFPHCFR